MRALWRKWRRDRSLISPRVPRKVMSMAIVLEPDLQADHGAEQEEAPPRVAMQWRFTATL